MLWASKQSNQVSSIKTPLVVTAIGIWQFVRSEMVAQASAFRSKLSTPHSKGSPPCKIRGNSVSEHLEMCSSMRRGSCCSTFGAHQFGFAVHGGVAEPITIGTVDITSGSYLYQ